MQSIDINFLIRQENRSGFNSQEPKKYFFDLEAFSPLFEECSAMVITNYTGSDQGYLFCLVVNQTFFELTERKGGKTRTFRIDWDKQFLSVGQRRGFSDDLDTLKLCLKKISAFLVSGHPKLWIEQSQQKLELNPVKDLSDLFGLPENNRLASVTEKEKSLSQLAALNIRHFIQMMERPTSASNLSRKIGAIQSLFYNILGQETRVVIFNKLHALSPVPYVLTFTRQIVSFIEQGKEMVSRLDIHFQNRIYTLNDAVLTQSGLIWFLKKLDQIMRDLDESHAEILVE